MPPASETEALHLFLQPGEYFVFKYTTNDLVPPDLWEFLSRDTGRFLSLTRTSEEVSVVGEWNESLPAELASKATWRCLKIKGPLDFGLTGIMADLTTPLKEAKIPVFVLSTWNTDYVLIEQKHIDRAIEALKKDSWTVNRVS